MYLGILGFCQDPARKTSTSCLPLLLAFYPSSCIFDELSDIVQRRLGTSLGLPTVETLCPFIRPRLPELYLNFSASRWEQIHTMVEKTPSMLASEADMGEVRSQQDGTITKGGLQKSLKDRHLSMIALGGSLGTGLLVGTYVQRRNPSFPVLNN